MLFERHKVACHSAKMWLWDSAYLLVRDLGGMKHLRIVSLLVKTLFENCLSEVFQDEVYF